MIRRKMMLTKQHRPVKRYPVSLWLLWIVMGATLMTIGCGETEPQPETTAEAGQLWTCGMHPNVLVDTPGLCPICNMNLVEVKTTTDETINAMVNTTQPAEEHIHEGETGAEIWTCPMHPDVLTHESGQCPICNMNLVQAEISADNPIWTCPMHPDVLTHESDQCPICNMNLVEVETAGDESPKAQTMGQAQDNPFVSDPSNKDILYWRAPMDPTFISEKPGKSPMGMDLVPVYEGEVAAAGPTIIIDPVTIQNIGVQTTPVRREALYRAIRTVSHVDYNEEAFSRVNIKFSGWIEQLHTDQTGQPVRKGQAMLEIYSPELVSTQEEYLLAFHNMKKLNDGAFAEISAGAQSLLEATRRRLLNWDITAQQIHDLETRGKATKTMTIYAPSNGIVVEKHAELGMRVMAGMDLFRIADLSTVWIYAHFYEQEAPWIKKGQLVEMELPYNPGKMYQGRVDYVYPYLDQKTRDIKVRIVFSNPRLELKPNMYANISLKINMGSAVTVVPNDTVIRSGMRNLIFVALGGGKFEPREVILGVEGEDGLVQIMAGVSPGEEVVNSAQFLMDSESRLKEAIQKMLETRRQGQSGQMSPEQPSVIEPR
jgi:Cu(I)/Ag(I) efflux system membrane fusion protein